MNIDDEINLHTALENIEYRLEIIEAKLGITDVYMDMEAAQKILAH